MESGVASVTAERRVREGFPHQRRNDTGRILCRWFTSPLACSRRGPAGRACHRSVQEHTLGWSQTRCGCSKCGLSPTRFDGSAWRVQAERGFQTVACVIRKKRGRPSRQAEASPAWLESCNLPLFRVMLPLEKKPTGRKAGTQSKTGGLLGRSPTRSPGCRLRDRVLQ